MYRHLDQGNNYGTIMFILCGSAFSPIVLFELLIKLRDLGFNITLFDWFSNVLTPGCADMRHHILHPNSKHGHPSVLRACSTSSCTPCWRRLYVNRECRELWQHHQVLLLDVSKTIELIDCGLQEVTGKRTRSLSPPVGLHVGYRLLQLPQSLHQREGKQWDNSFSSSACWRGTTYSPRYSASTGAILTTPWPATSVPGIATAPPSASRH